jgi:hypothetical protein
MQRPSHEHVFRDTAGLLNPYLACSMWPVTLVYVARGEIWNTKTGNTFPGKTNVERGNNFVNV